MRSRLFFVALLGSFGLAGCGPSGPAATAYRQPVVTTTPPLGASPGPTMAQSGPRPPAFDKNGNANYDANGNYVGGHGVGTLVDNPDRPAPPAAPSDMVRNEQQKVDDA